MIDFNEIEFRGRDTKTNEWVYGYLLGDGQIGAFIITNKIPNIKHDEEGKAILFYREEDFKQVKINTVGRYIGKKDMNEIKLYEGDKIKAKDLLTYSEVIGTITIGNENSVIIKTDDGELYSSVALYNFERIKEEE